MLVRRGMSNTCMLLCNRPRIEARANPFEQNPAGVPRDPCYIAFSSDRAFFFAEVLPCFLNYLLKCIEYYLALCLTQKPFFYIENLSKV